MKIRNTNTRTHTEAHKHW
uniref:Uncharacterized protein n=1 Tax=Rhizophora mucronata TaxID=61149 RepID=A0A2P2P8A9_RHIMU